MADTVSQYNIGAIVVPTSSVRPQSFSGTTINGAAIDRALHVDPDSCVLFLDVGAVSGTPTATSIVATLQDSADGSTFAAYAPSNMNGVTQATSAVTAANTQATLNVNLSSARRYVRVSISGSFTGGSSPAALVSSSLVLAGEAASPAV